MSINTSAQRIKDNVSASFDAVQNKNGTVPESKVIANLPAAIESIPSGSSLNFEIVGNPKPANPSNNTIWLNTDTPIVNYFLVSDIAELEADLNFDNGDVYIQIGTDSDAKFSLVDDWPNVLMVYPLSAMQYVNGAWVKLYGEASIDNEWIPFSSEWNGELYDIGNQYTDKTGGWGSSGWKPYYPNFATTPPTFNDSGMVITTVNSPTSGDQFVISGTQNKIDLSNYDTINVTVTDYEETFWIGVTKDKVVWDDSDYLLLARQRISKNGVIPLSVSSISSGYISIFGYTNGKDVTFGAVKKIKME